MTKSTDPNLQDGPVGPPNCLPFISPDYRNASRVRACTGNVEVTTTPLETKPRESVVNIQAQRIAIQKATG